MWKYDLWLFRFVDTLATRDAAGQINVYASHVANGWILL